MHYHFLIQLPHNFCILKRCRHFIPWNSLFSGFLWQTAFLASKPLPSSTHYSFIFPLYLPNKRSSYPKSLTVTLWRTHPLATAWLHLSSPTLPFLHFYCPARTHIWGVPRAPQLRLPKTALILLPPEPGSPPEFPQLLWQFMNQTQHSESLCASLCPRQHYLKLRYGSSPSVHQQKKKWYIHRRVYYSIP